jgi:hypothetical protein
VDDILLNVNEATFTTAIVSGIMFGVFFHTVMGSRVHPWLVLFFGMSLGAIYYLPQVVIRFWDGVGASGWPALGGFLFLPMVVCASLTRHWLDSREADHAP